MDPFGEDELLEKRTWTDLDLPGHAIRGREFHRCTFVRVRMSALRLENCQLESCVFQDCDLHQFQPVRTALRGVRFLGCKLMGTDWGGVSPNPDVAFEDCDLRYAVFMRMNLRKASILRCEVREAGLTDVDLTESDFSGTDLGGTTFDRCELVKANLSTARNAYVDPARNRVKGARVAVDSAVLLALAAGMKVAGYEDAAPEPKSPKRNRG